MYYHDLMGKVEKHEGEKYWIVDDCMLNEVLDKVKEMISIEKFYDAKVLIDTDDILPDDITLKVVI